MRYAILADVHGNPIALGAVLADVGLLGGIDGYLILGDLAAGGYDPSGAVERLRSLPNARFVRGNTDRALALGQPGPSLAATAADPERAARELVADVMFAWSHGHLAGRAHLAWLSSLPLEARLVLPDGTRVLMVHAAPGADGYDGQGRQVTPATTDDELRGLLAGSEADLVLVGHTHSPFDRSVDGVRVVNPGSVSNPWGPDLRASYALLDAGPSGYGLELRRAAYDVGAVLDRLRASGHPTFDLLASNLREDRHPPWAP